jgi:hypothetical protein
VLARATGIFIERNPAVHFERHRQWLAEQDRAENG